MRPSSRMIALALGLMALFPFRASAQDNSGWRISPEKINIQVGQDRRLQLLDGLAQELHDAVWSIDDSALAELQAADGRAGGHTKAVGTVRGSATLAEET